MSAAARLREPGRYRIDGREVPAGLYLRITDTGARYWLLRFVTQGTEHWMGLGADNVIGAKGAIERARTARVALMEGRDPIAERRVTKAQAQALSAASVPFKEAANKFHQHHSGRWSSRMGQQWISQVENFAFPVLGDLPVNAIDRAAVLRAFSPHWVAGKVHAAARVLGRVQAILDFCVQRGWRDNSDNPASWKHLQHALARPQSVSPVKQMASLPYTEVPAFVTTLGDSVTERALKFTILTAVRSNEALGARWSEIDLERAIWTIPAERMKKRKEHTVPLSSSAVEILNALPREKGNPFCFVGARQGSALNATAMITLLNRRKCAFGVHGFRASFRTWASEQTQFPPDVIEICLAHLIGSGVERAYNRAQLIEKRRLLMEAWAAFVTGTTTTSATVIPLRAPA
jgi:integrase